MDFAALDHLALAVHPALRAAASRPDPQAVSRLETALAAFCQMPEARAFASFADAARATLGALLGPGDVVVLDAGSHPAVAGAVLASGAEVLRCPAGSVAAVERRLIRLRPQPRRGRLVLCLPAISARASVAADLVDLVPLAAAHGAVLVVDVSQDFGTIALSGRGLLEIQGQHGRADILMGALDGACGVPAGFAAVRAPSPLPRANLPPLAPLRAAMLLAALELLDSAEGQRRRRRLHHTSLRLRNHLMADGFRPLGQPSPVVPLPLPPQRAQAMAGLLAGAGPVAPLIAAPEVGSRSPRWLFRLSAAHSPADIDDLADLIRDIARVTRRDGSRAMA
jgi:7-keto-8-aminopelargonate synthetase-like enzyme